MPDLMMSDLIYPAIDKFIKLWPYHKDCANEIRHQPFLSVFFSSHLLPDVNKE